MYARLDDQSQSNVEHAEDYLLRGARFYYNRKCLSKLAEKSN